MPCVKKTDKTKNKNIKNKKDNTTQQHIILLFTIKKFIIQSKSRIPSTYSIMSGYSLFTAAAFSAFGVLQGG
jgi:hypothetical protein